MILNSDFFLEFYDWLKVNALDRIGTFWSYLMNVSSRVAHGTDLRDKGLIGYADMACWEL